jgi:predicted transcriptional regulator
MSAAAILSIKPIYVSKILAGTKTIELRKSSMGLNSGDVILVYSSVPEQQITFWFQIQAIETLRVDSMWDRYRDVLGIGHEEYMEYFSGVEYAVALHVGRVQQVSPVSLREIQRLVPGFVPPQGLIWLKDDIGRFERLLASLSAPLPADVFTQQSLF